MKKTFLLGLAGALALAAPVGAQAPDADTLVIA